MASLTEAVWPADPGRDEPGDELQLLVSKDLHAIFAGLLHLSLG